MKPPLFWALGILLAAAIVLAWLNVRERDSYPYGQAGAPFFKEVPNDDGQFRAMIPETLAHACGVCGSCVHNVEVVENRRQLAVTDEDGWHRLFWAGAETYYYEDPVAMAEALNNPTARAPRGTWIIHLRLGLASHPPSKEHVCTEAPREIRLEYSLINPRLRPSEEVHALGFSTAKNWFISRYVEPPYEVPAYFAWVISKMPAISTAPCPCP